MNVLTTISRNIRSARKTRGFSQEKLAELAHISVRMLGNIERAKSNPSILVLCNICLALNMSLDEIVEFKPKENIEELPDAGQEERGVS